MSPLSALDLIETPELYKEIKLREMRSATGTLADAYARATAEKVQPSQAAAVRRSQPPFSSYATLDVRLIRVARGGADRLIIEVSGMPEAGEARAEIEMPAPQVLLQQVNETLRHSQAAEDPAGGAVPKTVRQVGEIVGQALLPTGALNCFSKSCAVAQLRKMGLRVRLFIYDVEIASIPWEVAFVGNDFVSIRKLTPIVRYVLTDEPVQPIAVIPPVKILGIISRSQPPGAAVLDVEREKQNIEDGLKKLQEDKLVELHWLPKATWKELQNNVANGYHIIHYIGHSGYDAQKGEGWLSFEEVDGKEAKMTGINFARLIRDLKVKFVFLNSCDSAHEIGSIAEELVRWGVPAVLGMRRPVLDRIAIEFASMFYNKLADAWPVDAALVEGRLAILGESNGDARTGHWTHPVLFTRAPDGQIFI